MDEFPSGGDLEGLRAELKRIGPVVVAFSGGADSAFLAWVATDTLGPEQVLCVTAVSPSLAPEELADCRALAAEWGLTFREMATDELADPAYSANDGSRCFHCKTALMEGLGPVAAEHGHPSGATIVLGVNLDDLGDHRPGQRAALDGGARFPLVAAGFTKSAVRQWSRQLGLRTWDKPAAACLASRVPYGTPVTLGTLRLGGPRPSQGSGPWASASCGSATTATPPASRCPWKHSPRWWRNGPRCPAWCTPPATGTSPWISTGSGRATSTTRCRRPGRFRIGIGIGDRPGRAGGHPAGR